MLFPAIRKVTAFIYKYFFNRLRPGFAGNIAFLLISVSMAALIAHSDYINDFKITPCLAKDFENPAAPFSDDDLFFF